ncbi:MAG: sigma-70 family RNA polymerase sigma factor [Bdellovibrionales bacterium]|nr:sigma-70 family RNA polymerase sigma factor [Bdellovibrionales bacterium]
MPADRAVAPIAARPKRLRKFTTLSEVEQELVDEGLYSRKRAEVLCKKSKTPEWRVASPEASFPDVELRELLDTPERMTAFLYRAARDPAFASHALRDRRPGMTSQLSTLTGPWPATLKDSCLWTLIARKEFGDPENKTFVNAETRNAPAYDPKLLLAAYLISRNLNTREAMEFICPGFPFEEFHAYQSRIHRKVESSLNERSRRFQEYWDALTAKQREAIRAVYFDNEEDLTDREVADALGISAYSLQDRVAGAIKKLEAHFSEFVPMRISRGLGHWTALAEGPDVKNYSSRSERRVVRPLFRIDSATGRRVRIESSGAATRTRVANFETHKQWLKVTSYRPTHDGVESPLYAHMVAKPLKRTEKGRQESRRSVATHL